jgi:hypothetical protein
MDPGVPPEPEYATSDAFPAGFDTMVTASRTAGEGELRVYHDGAWSGWSTSEQFYPGDILEVRVLSPEENAADKSMEVTVGGQAATFNVLSFKWS